MVVVRGWGPGGRGEPVFHGDGLSIREDGVALEVDGGGEWLHDPECT